MSYRGALSSDTPSLLRAISHLPPPNASAPSSLSSAVHASTHSKTSVCYDVAALTSCFSSASKTFGPNFTHALAAKGCPLRFILRLAVSHGLGVECASWGECVGALSAGCPPSKIVFDSPAKTREELRWALESGVVVNCDNLAELERVDELWNGESKSVVGLRVNPIVSGGKIEMFAVSTTSSKFGYPLHTEESRLKVVAAFGEYPWLRCLHAHVSARSEETS